MSTVTSGFDAVRIVELAPFGVRIEAEEPDRDPRDLPVEGLRELVRSHQLVLLRGFASIPSAEELLAWGETWGEVKPWSFGKVLELVEADAPTDHIFDNSYVPLHWDGMYGPSVPEFQLFTCVSAPRAGQGGRTTFCHAAKVLQNASPELAALWRDVTVTYQIQNVSHYGGKTMSPLVVPHPVTGVPTFRYNEPAPAEDEEFLNRPSHTFDGFAEDELADRLEELRAALYDERFFYAHSWEDGDVVIADNYTMLHGREAFTHRSARHLRRVHVLGDPPLLNVVAD